MIGRAIDTIGGGSVARTSLCFLSFFELLVSLSKKEKTICSGTSCVGSRSKIGGIGVFLGGRLMMMKNGRGVRRRCGGVEDDGVEGIWSDG